MTERTMPPGGVGDSGFAMSLRVSVRACEDRRWSSRSQPPPVLPIWVKGIRSLRTKTFWGLKKEVSEHSISRIWLLWDGPASAGRSSLLAAVQGAIATTPEARGRLPGRGVEGGWYVYNLWPSARFGGPVEVSGGPKLENKAASFFFEKK